MKSLTTLATEQLSAFTGTAIVTAAVQTPAPAACVKFVGQVIVGFCVSVIVTVNEQFAVFKLPSVTT